LPPGPIAKSSKQRNYLVPIRQRDPSSVFTRPRPKAVIGRIEIPQRSTPSPTFYGVRRLCRRCSSEITNGDKLKWIFLGKHPSGRFLELAHRADSRCECSRHIRPDFGAGLTAIRSYQIKNVGGAV
jgi:hypothetical protein